MTIVFLIMWPPRVYTRIINRDQKALLVLGCIHSIQKVTTVIGSAFRAPEYLVPESSPDFVVLASECVVCRACLSVSASPAVKKNTQLIIDKTDFQWSGRRFGVEVDFFNQNIKKWVIFSFKHAKKSFTRDSSLINSRIVLQ